MAVLAFGLACLLAATAAWAKPSNKWRLEVSEGANSDGVIVVEIVPEGGTATDISIQIKDGTGENHVARVIKDALEQQLGKGYHVEVDDGEDVLVKAKSGTPHFDMVIKQQTVTGVRLHLQRE
ncbi:hypothetical protein ABB29_08475 [Pseudoxanthomonas dokdonensis]|uniref:Uncharacterized protein n=2 Tax=Pseudoxanthomonas dokdonensis TaxID=344882 RepID=A0A0R0CJX8_9GAMM|nr:hypothetical protein ABB29_08475 [Pseudoxanthomonas dokdonensis]